MQPERCCAVVGDGECDPRNDSCECTSPGTPRRPARWCRCGPWLVGGTVEHPRRGSDVHPAVRLPGLGPRHGPAHRGRPCVGCIRPCTPNRERPAHGCTGAFKGPRPGPTPHPGTTSCQRTSVGTLGRKGTPRGVPSRTRCRSGARPALHHLCGRRWTLPPSACAASAGHSVDHDHHAATRRPRMPAGLGVAPESVIAVAGWVQAEAPARPHAAHR